VVGDIVIEDMVIQRIEGTLLVFVVGTVVLMDRLVEFVMGTVEVLVMIELIVMGKVEISVMMDMTVPVLGTVVMVASDILVRIEVVFVMDRVAFVVGTLEVAVLGDRVGSEQRVGKSGIVIEDKMTSLNNNLTDKAS
jgi:hypothetical protein